MTGSDVEIKYNCNSLLYSFPVFSIQLQDDPVTL